MTLLPLGEWFYPWIYTGRTADTSHKLCLCSVYTLPSRSQHLLAMISTYAVLDVRIDNVISRMSCSAAGICWTARIPATSSTEYSLWMGTQLWPDVVVLSGTDLPNITAVSSFILVTTPAFFIAAFESSSGISQSTTSVHNCIRIPIILIGIS